MTIVIEMSKDNTVLPELVIHPLSYRRSFFKQAVLALNVPMDDRGINQRNFNAELMALMMRTTPMDGNLNYRLLHGSI